MSIKYHKGTGYTIDKDLYQSAKLDKDGNYFIKLKGSDEDLDIGKFFNLIKQGKSKNEICNELKIDVKIFSKMLKNNFNTNKITEARILLFEKEKTESKPEILQEKKI